jgi:hypothetical protein
MSLARDGGWRRRADVANLRLATCVVAWRSSLNGTDPSIGTAPDSDVSCSASVQMGSAASGSRELFAVST